MKIFTSAFFVLVFLGAGAAMAQSTPWTSLNTGIQGGNITSVFSFGDYLYAGTYYDGIYVSTDKGNNWKPSSNGLPKFSYITSIVSDGVNLFAASYYSGIYISTDKGVTWKNMLNQQVTAMQLINGSLFCATVNGIWVTTDSGVTSKTVNNGLPSGPAGTGIAGVNCLASKDNSLFAGLFYKGMYRSNDNGTTWTALTNGFPTDSNVTSVLVFGAAVIAGTNTGIYISYDNGNSWLNYTSGLPTNFPAYSLAAYNNRIFAGTAAYGLYYSDNNGSTWQSVNIGINNLESVQTLYVSGSTIYAGSSKSGVFVSNDGGTMWAAKNNGLTNESIQVLTKKGGSIFAGTPGCKIYESKDNGSTWTVVNSQMSLNPLTSLTVKADSLFATTNGSGILVSIDNGINWTSITGNLISSSPQAYDLVVHKNKIIIGNVTGTHKYNTQTGEWIPLGVGFPSNPLVYKLLSRNNALYAGTYSYGLFQSRDDGASWSKANLPASALTINSITSSGEYVIITANGNTFSSKDDGVTWQTHSANTVGNAITTSAAVDSSYVFFGGYDGVYTSADHGLTMSLSNTGLPPVAWVFSLLVDGDNLLAGTSEGIWSTPISSFSPIITSFSPSSGSPGTLVTITGKNFDNLPEYNIVKFNGTAAKVVSVATTGLVVEVPGGATKGRIEISVVGRTTITASDFCVSPIKPTITANGLATSSPVLTSSSNTGNQWFLNNDPIEGAVNQTLTVSKEGTYTVQVTDNGCASLPSEGFSLIVTQLEDGINLTSDISICPVPANNKVTINLDHPIQNEKISIQILNSFGQEMYINEVKDLSSFSVEVSDYINGIYFVRVRYGNEIREGRFIKL